MKNNQNKISEKLDLCYTIYENTLVDTLHKDVPRSKIWFKGIFSYLINSVEKMIEYAKKQYDSIVNSIKRKNQQKTKKT